MMNTKSMMYFQAKRALQRGATAVVLDITDNPVAAEMVRHLIHPCFLDFLYRLSYCSCSLSVPSLLLFL